MNNIGNTLINFLKNSLTRDTTGTPEDVINSTASQAVSILEVVIPVLAGVGIIYCLVLVAIRVYKAMRTETTDEKRAELKNIFWIVGLAIFLIAVAVSSSYLEEILEAANIDVINKT